MIIHTQRFRPYFSRKRLRMEKFSLREEIDSDSLSWIDGIPHYMDLPVLISLRTDLGKGAQHLKLVSNFNTFEILPEYKFLFKINLE